MVLEDGVVWSGVHLSGNTKEKVSKNGVFEEGCRWPFIRAVFHQRVLLYHNFLSCKVETT